MVMEKVGKRPFWRDLVVWGILALLLAAMVVVVALAPAEQSLGSGIKVVYVHVALIWTGMALMLVNGLVGLAEAVLARPFLERWRQVISMVMALPILCSVLLMTMTTAILTSFCAIPAAWRFTASMEPH